MLAKHLVPGRAPTVIFLPGYASDMTGSKALALEGWARERGQAFLRFDYRGCGASPGRFEDQTLADWRDDAIAMIDAVDGPVVLVGSSMGGWLMLLAALARPDRIAALVGIAAAPDFTDWGFDAADREALVRNGRLQRPSPYSDAPTLYTRALVESGAALRLLGGDIAIEAPVRLIHGQRDPDVPWQHSLTLAERLRSADVQVTLIKHGDHRLSRPEDIRQIIATVEGVLPVSC
ncbi:alpha/beta hydrolase family protein [Sphingomonas sp. GlSt437]|uniref:alpha/beta hydrolase family protein n=1 Tax=Sphingomonas sp. GlSt437 TaxID=3389970 RepID=UPI003A876BE5